MKTLTISIPESVWDDALDPSATDMPGEMGLPAPRFRRVGKGGQNIYEDVPVEVVAELADYLRDRAWTLIGNVEPEERGVFRRMAEVAQRLRGQVELARRLGG